MPEAWSRVPLGEIAREIRDRLDPSDEPDLPYVGLADVNPEQRRIPAFGLLDDVSSLKTRFRPGDVLFGKLRPYLHKVAQADREGGASTDILVIRPRNGLDPNFLYWRLTSKAVVNYAERHSAGTKMPRTSWARLADLAVPLPPAPEQRKIAAVLSSVDDAIGATRRVMVQTNRLKQGLLQTFMTRGIGHTRFNKTEIGEIPEPWDVAPAEDVCEKISVGIVVRPAALYQDSGVPCIRSANIGADGIVDEDWVWISEESSQEHAKSILRAGDVVVVRTGEPGVACVVPDWLDKCNCVDVIFARPRAKELDPQFLALFLNSYAGHSQVLQKRGGLAQKHLNVGALKRMHVPVPPLAEQVEIIERIRSVQEAGTSAKREADSLQNLRRGLMQDLLTGRVRVQPD